MKITSCFRFIAILFAIVLFVATGSEAASPSKTDQKTTSKDVSKETDGYQYCIANGGKNVTPHFNTLKKCTLNNRIFESMCVSNDKYFIISKDAIDYAGSDILIKYKSSPNQQFSCQYVKEASDFEKLNNESVQYIIALEGDYLILDQGTGPDPRGLTVYDLSQKSNAFVDSYSEPIEVKNHAISYWTETSTKPTPKNCPELSKNSANSFESAIENHVTLDLLTLKKKERGEQRCSSRQ